MGRNRDQQKVTVTIDRELHERATAYATTHDRSVANLMRHALRQYLKRYPVKTDPDSTE